MVSGREASTSRSVVRPIELGPMGTGSSTSSGHPHAPIAAHMKRNLMPFESRVRSKPYSG
jgi:hypothetical protein